MYGLDLCHVLIIDFLYIDINTHNDNGTMQSHIFFITVTKNTVQHEIYVCVVKTLFSITRQLISGIGAHLNNLWYTFIQSTTNVSHDIKING